MPTPCAWRAKRREPSLAAKQLLAAAGRVQSAARALRSSLLHLDLHIIPLHILPLTLLVLAMSHNKQQASQQGQGWDLWWVTLCLLVGACWFAYVDSAGHTPQSKETHWSEPLREQWGAYVTTATHTGPPPRHTHNCNSAPQRCSAS